MARRSVLHGQGHRSGRGVQGTPQISPGPGQPPIPSHPIHGKGHRSGISGKKRKK